MKSDKRKNKSIFPIVMGILWGFLIANTIFLVISIYDYDDRFYADARDIANNITSEEFSQISSDVGRQLANGLTFEAEPEYEVLIAIRNYFDAAAQYHMYAEDGQSVKADYYHNKMMDAQKNLGQFDYLAAKIDKRFSIE